MSSDLLHRIQTAKIRAAEDVVIAHLREQGLAGTDNDRCGVKTPPADAELPNRGPRVTPADIEAEIASEHYFTAADGYNGAHDKGDHEGGWADAPQQLGLLTFCVLVLRNGFPVTGKSACTSPENFDAEIGKRIARADAIAQLWPLLAFRLRDKLAHESGRAGTDPQA